MTTYTNPETTTRPYAMTGDKKTDKRFLVERDGKPIGMIQKLRGESWKAFKAVPVSAKLAAMGCECGQEYMSAAKSFDEAFSLIFLAAR